MTTQLLEKFVRLASALSPENLSHDGELTNSEVARQHRILTLQWKGLEKQVGRTVSEREVWTMFEQVSQARRLQLYSETIQ